MYWIWTCLTIIDYVQDFDWIEETCFKCYFTFVVSFTVSINIVEKVLNTWFHSTTSPLEVVGTS